MLLTSHPPHFEPAIELFLSQMAYYDVASDVWHTLP